MNACAAADAPAQPRRVTDRERFLTFALAAAEMLLEVSPDGRIGFAAGAFQSRLGQPPDAWLGRQVRDLVALPDRRNSTSPSARCCRVTGWRRPASG